MSVKTIKGLFAILLTVMLLLGSQNTALALTKQQYINRYKSEYADYLKFDKVIADSFRKTYTGKTGEALVGRAIWYMQNGYMVYGHTKYPETGRIDCSNFVSLVYKDFGYSITSAARKYNTVGTRISGVYSKLQPGSTRKYTMVGLDNLRPGDILTFWAKDSSGNKYIGHVALYMGKINGKPAIIHTKKERPTAIGIVNDFTWWYGEHFYGARRVLTDQQYNTLIKKLPAPVIPKVYQLPPQKTVVMPASLPLGF